jgi:hypothetical protein
MLPFTRARNLTSPQRPTVGSGGSLNSNNRLGRRRSTLLSHTLRFVFGQRAVCLDTVGAVRLGDDARLPMIDINASNGTGAWLAGGRLPNQWGRVRT